MTEPSPVLDPQPTASTPEPVIKAAALWGTLATFIVTAVGVLVAVGVLSNEQAVAINELSTYVSTNIVPVGTVIVGLVGLASGIVSHLVTAFTARRHVTPVAPAKVREVR